MGEISIPLSMMWSIEKVASLSSFRLAECLKPELMDRPDLDLLSQYNTYFLLELAFST
jgi:hypothetical protein